VEQCLLKRFHPEESNFTKNENSRIVTSGRILDQKNSVFKNERNAMGKIEKKQIEDIFALTPMQEGMLLQFVKEPESSKYIEQLTLELKGNIDNSRFEKAWNMVAESNEMLRAAFKWRKLEKPVQIILRQNVIKPQYIDLSESNEEEKKDALENIKRKDRTLPFDLQTVPFRITLVRKTNSKSNLIITNHHILYDGWSNGIILNEFFQNYNNLTQNALSIDTTFEKNRKTKFKEFVKWSQKKVKDQEAKQYWEKYLDGLDTHTELSIKKKKRTDDIKGVETYRQKLDTNLVQCMGELSKQRRITQAAVLYSVLGVLIQKYNNTGDVVFGTTVSGRDTAIKGVEQIVGLFINTLPFRIKDSNGETIAQLMKTVDNDLRQRKEREHDPLVEINKASPLHDNTELFDTLMVLENYPLDRRLKENKDSALTVESYRITEEASYDLIISITEYDDMEVAFIYDRASYEKSTVKGIFQHFQSLLKHMVQRPESTLQQIEWISEEEKQNVLVEFNRTETDYPKDKCIIQVLEEQLLMHADHIAVSMNSGENAETLSISYSELGILSDKVAHHLRKKGIKEGMIVAQVAETSIEMIIGILAILKTGAAYLPIDPAYPAKRIQYMLEDSHVPLQLTIKKISEILQTPVENDAIPPAGKTDKLAYIMYTSGSTGRPKGVMVEHRNVVRLVKNTNYLKWTETCRILQTGSLSFDASTFEIWGAILNGAQLHLAGKEILLSPVGMKKIIRRNNITTAWMTASLYNQLLDADIEIFETLENLLVGGDVLSIHHINRLVKRYSHINIINGYGPTENTTFSTTYAINRLHRTGIPIGKPIANSTAVIIDKDGQIAPVGVNGELYVGGDGVARGYLNQPELTAEKFIDSKFPHHNGRLYKTGDQTRWLPDGNIEFSGRIDQQVKIRGYRIELGEIESQLRSFDEIKDAVLQVIETEEKSLCAYIVSDDTIKVEEIKKRMANKLPEYMIPASFMQIEEIPLTINGKVNRKRLPKPKIVSATPYVAPRNEAERTLEKIWRDILDITRKKEEVSIGIDDNFFQVGGHSLKAAGMMGRVHKHFNIEIPYSVFFENPTIRGIYSYIKDAEQRDYEPVPNAEEKEYYPLAASQKRFYVFQQLRPADTSYNMTETMQLEGDLPVEKIEITFKKLMERHDSLRASFHMVDGEPVQRFQKHVPFGITYYPLERVEEKGPAAIIEEFVKPFDLTSPPLWRIAFVNTAPGTHYLVFDMHHIIGDGTSIGIFVRDFNREYNQQTHSPLRVQYRDFVQWQEQKRRNTEKSSENKPDEQLDDELLNLPTDNVRPPVQTFEGNMIRVDAGKQRTREIYALCVRLDATLYMAMMGVFKILLSRLSGQENIAVGSPIAGREHVDSDNIIGLFLHTICLRSRINGEKQYSRYLKEVKELAVQAYENQDSQYDELVKKASMARNSGRNPLFDVMLVVQNMDMPDIRLPGLTVTREVGEYSTSKFDLTLYVEERDTLIFKWEYSIALFKEKTIRRFIRYFQNILEQVLENPDCSIGQLEIVTGEEKHRMLVEFNRTETPYPSDKTIYSLLEEQAQKTPDRIALIGVNSDEHANREKQNKTLTYRQLHEKSNRIARYLRSKGAGRGTIIGLMVERSVDMVVTILAIQKSGGTYIPIDPAYPDNRIQWILEGSGAAMLLTGSEKKIDLPEGRQLRQQTMTEINAQLQDFSPDNPGHLSDSNDLIYIIFTSGSTGKPKGAGVYHRSFMNLMHWYVTEYRLGQDDRTLLLTSPSFDLTQKNFYAPLMTGGILVIPGIDYFEPRFLLRQIHEHRITNINCTPSMFYKMVEQEQASEEKKLSSLRYVFLGGEPITMTALIDWLESEHSRAEIVNTYGPTECTDICGAFRIREPRRYLEEVIPVGAPINNVQLYVVDKNRQIVPVGVPGELLIGGAGVGIGYVNDREQTQQKFIFHSFEHAEPDRLLYRTGDLVKWRPDGKIEFLGRIDHQVKVRGFRIELGEIENRLLNHDDVKEALVMAKDAEAGEKFLCAYIVSHSRQPIPEAELRAYIAAELPDYMVPAYIIQLERMPLNPNGKVDRKALPEPDVSAKENHVPPQTDTEIKVAEIIAGVLGLDKAQVGKYDNFFLLGGHSLKAATLVGQIHKVFSVEMPMAKLFQAPTTEGISRNIEESGERVYEALQPTERREYYPLTSAQKRMYLINKMAPGSVSYNIPALLEVDGEFDGKRFENAIKEMIERHESLRTSFIEVNGEPVQRVHNTVTFEMEYGGTDPFVRPFALSRAPLLRVGLRELPNGKKQLHFDMHHIISDGVSMGIFTREISRRYAGEALPEQRIQYKDYSIMQNRRETEESLKKQEQYWLSQFEGEIPVLELPQDYPRTAEPQLNGKIETFRLEEEDLRQLDRIAASRKTTLFTVLLSLYGILLSKLDGKEDVVVGCPTAGRQHPDQENIIGMFVNTMPQRLDVNGRITLGEYIDRVNVNFQAAGENPDYPYEELVEKVVENRDPGRNPLYDAVFVMQNMDVQPLELPGATLTPQQQQTGTTKFDITMICEENSDSLNATVEYSSQLFKPSSIRRFIDYFKELQTGIEEKIEKPISEIEILPQNEKNQLLFEFNKPAPRCETGKTLHGLFRQQAQKTPNHLALQGMTGNLTYRQLDEKADGLAGKLIEQGVRPGDIVGLKIERSLEMLIGILGILKTGAAYLPINPKNPEQRTRYMLNDSKAKQLLTEVEIKDIIGNVEMTPTTVPAPSINDVNLVAYIIYTSGSTGEPKGVPMTHRNICPLLHWGYDALGLGEEDRVIQNLAYYFDWSVWEMFIALTGGSTLVIADENILLNPDAMLDKMETDGITALHITPTQYRYLANTGRKTPTLKYLFIGAEKLTYDMVENAFELISETGRLFNMYGPTEAAIISGVLEIHRRTYNDYRRLTSIPIGKPMANAALHILDKYDKLCPVNVAGELYITGDGLAAGYLNNPELTAEKFRSILLPEDKHYRSHRSYQTYRTGDLARWLPEGTVEFLGRIDHQVKIRGLRIELGEIENKILTHEKVKEAVVIDRERSGDKYLCAYIVGDLDKEKLSEEIKEHLAIQLPQYMVPASYVRLENIPLNPNGKVNRKALPEPDRHTKQAKIAPMDAVEARLVEIWRDVLETVGPVGVDDNFFESGGHSLKATRLLSKIQDALQVEIPLIEIFSSPTVRGLADIVRNNDKNYSSTIEPVEQKEYYPLSSPQERQYVLQKMVRDTTGYNITEVVQVEGPLDIKKLKYAFNQLVWRHESLRTSFREIDGQPVQVIHDNVLMEIEEHENEERFVRPYDLAEAPLMRVGIVKESESGHRLMVDMHHIISDGASVKILVKEFIQYYGGSEPAALRIQYKDFAEWSNRREQKERIQRQAEYWRKQFEGEIPAINLPTDYPRPAIQQFDGARKEFVLEKEETEALKKLAVEHGGTLYMMMLAVTTMFLSAITGRDDIVVGTPVAGRNHPELQDSIGMYVNTLALRQHTAGNKTIKEYLEQVKRTALDAFENSDYPYEELVDQAVAQRDPSRNPLFDVAFTMMDEEIGEALHYELPELQFKPVNYETGISKFDLTIVGKEEQEKIYLQLEYNTKLFKPENIDRLIGNYKQVVSEILKGTDKKISEIEIITPEEKQRLLNEFNNPEPQYEVDKTLHGLFEEQVEKTPNHIALQGMTGNLTYSRLNEKADSLAVKLAVQGVEPGDIVGLKTERSLEMLIGILGILKAGAAYLPINPKNPEQRTRYMMDDSSAKLLLTEVEIKEITGGTETESASAPTKSYKEADRLAYIIYTSGSTGEPKGVPMAHRNVSPLLHWGFDALGLGEKDRVIQNLAYYFDWSVWEMFIALTAGSTLYITKEDTLLNPGAMLDYMETNGITALHITPTQYRYLANTGRKTPTLKYLFVGAEKLTYDLVENALKLISETGRLFNMYGPTETAIISAVLEIHRQNHKDYRRLTSIPIGKPMANAGLHILDKYDKLCPLNVAGELYISGDGLAAGYLNNPELSVEKFRSNLMPDNSNYRTCQFYKTGDLARWLPDGTMEFLGRIDHQVKIRGLRIELGEIENKLLTHEQVKEAVVIDRERNGDKYLCAYIVGDIDKEKLAEELKEHLTAQLPQYMIPTRYVGLDNIPLNPNGKVNRSALPEPSRESALQYAAPTNATETRLVEIWQDVLETDSPIGIDDNFFEQGGHSLKATQLASKIHKAYHVELPIIGIFTSPTIRKMAENIRQSGKKEYTSIVPADKKEYYFLSSAQRRQYHLHRMVENSTGYNITEHVEIEGNLNLERLNQAFAALIQRHESLRTSFHEIHDQPVQKVHEHLPFEIETIESPRQFVRPFNLTEAPLMRVGVMKISETFHHLMVDMHHIISDGESMKALVREFAALYEGRELEPQRLHYKDYAEWQDKSRQKERIRHQEEYWLAQFEGEIPVLHLPTDYPRPAVQQFDGARKEFRLSVEETEALKQQAGEQSLTMFMQMLTVTSIYLSRLTGQQELVVGTPVAGRNHADQQNMIGMFVNTLALRMNPGGEKTIKEYREEVKHQTLDAYENSDYPYEELVNRVVTNRDLSRNPLFDVLFTFIEGANREKSRQLGDLTLTPHNHETETTKFDLTIVGTEENGRLKVELEYGTRLFKPESVDRLIGNYKQVVSEILKNADKKISEIEIITPEEKQRILNEFNNPEPQYEVERTLHGLFEEQVEKTPNHIALQGMTGNLTYSRLNEKADRLAVKLAVQGVGPGDIVGLKIERSLEMLIGILGILKAGAAYLPINPKNPEQRIRYMLNDSSAKLLLTEVEIKEITGGTETESASVPTKSYKESERLAYIIYTSGSTGEPKGVPMTHRNVCPLLQWGYDALGLAEEDRVIHNLAYYFDWSVMEIFITITSGAALYIVGDDILLDPDRMIDTIKNESITALHITPTQYRYLANTGRKTPTLKYLFIGAEKLTLDMVEIAIKLISETGRLFNMYGPTEAAIICAVLEIHRQNHKDYRRLTSIPIGKPMANAGLHILDKYDKLCPLNVAGELYISGDGLAAGYLNNPELSAEKFHSNLLPDNSNYRTCKFYKTGDLARWLPDGTMEFLGRIDHQVKIRGLRIELGEIENKILTHEQVREAVIIDRERNGEKYLCAYIVGDIDEENLAGELKEYLSHQLPQYMIPTACVRMDNIPLNPNGKVNRKALPEPGRKTPNQYAAPNDVTEIRLVQIWQDVLEELGPIGIDDNFFEKGGHSLKATQLASRINHAYHVEIPIIDIFKNPTIRVMAEYIRNAAKKTFISIVPSEKREYYPVSSAQKRMYILNRMDTESTAYNIPGMIDIDGNVEAEKIETAIKKLIQRHESLRTYFIEVNGEPVQRIDDTVEFHMEIDETVPRNDNRSGECQHTEFIDFMRPFDLTRAPLLRAMLIKRNENKQRLLFDMHHIISDGTSMAIMTGEFSALMAGEQLPELALQYKDFSCNRQRTEDNPSMQLQEEYWLSQYKGEVPVLELPTDKERPKFQDFTGASIGFLLKPEKLNSIKEMAQQNGITEFMLLMAAFTIQLSKLSGMEDIVVGTPVAGRRNHQLQNIVGMFVNTLALRYNPWGELTVNEYLAELKNKTVAAYENQEYPFEDLVNKVDVERDAARNPIFDVMFTWQSIENEENPGESMPVSEDGYMDYGSVISKFDLTLSAMERNNSLEVNIEYSVRLFEKETIKRYAHYFERVLDTMIENPGIRICDIEILRGEERRRLLEELNATEDDTGKEKSIVEMVEAQAEKRPDAVAQVFHHQQMTYKQLMCHVNLHAGRLKQLGVKPETIAAVMVERGLEMIVALMAVQKAGAAYLPLDSDYPEERINYMLMDSNADVLLLKEDEKQKRESLLNRFKGNVHVIDSEPLDNNPAVEVDTAIAPSDMAYIIYTSGSTGIPRGVIVQHYSVVNLITHQLRRFRMTPGDRVLQFASISFDASVEQIYLALAGGAVLVNIDRETQLDSQRFWHYLNTRSITHLDTVPSFLAAMAREEEYQNTLKQNQLKRIVAGGDSCEPGLAGKWNRGNEFYNAYGHAETTVTSLIHKVSRQDLNGRRLAIGNPLINTKIYILDRWQKPVPTGAAGQLFIGGSGLARGYLNNPEQTADWFISNPVTGQGKLYATGDLCRWRTDGTVEFLGRIDHQVKIRGLRIELGEIENRLQAHQRIEDAVVIDHQRKGEKYLCAYIVGEFDRTTMTAELESFLAKYLPKYMIPGNYILMDNIPLGTSGKVDRKALPEPDLSQKSKKINPEGPIETRLAEIWKEILGDTIPIGADDNYFQLGGHSLNATQLASKIHKAFNVKLAVMEIFDAPTIRKQSGIIRKASKERHYNIEPVEEKEYYPVSSPQKRMFILQSTDAGGINYNMPFMVKITGILETKRIESVFRRIIQRHESLRTTFRIYDGRPVQRVHKTVDFEIEVQKTTDSFVRPFDLSRAPLMRVGLQELGKEKHILMVDMHHIISDGASTEVLMQEFVQLYAQKEPQLPPVQYKDITVWQNGEQGREAMRRQESYWLNKYRDDIPQLELPLDNPRPPLRSTEGAAVPFQFNEEMTAVLKRLAEEENATIFMVLMSIFNVFLSKLSWQEDIVVGVPTMGRRHEDQQGVIGMFVNTLAIRNKPRSDMTFKDFLAEVKKTTLEAFENQDYPFEDLADKVASKTDSSRNPLFDVMFTLQNIRQSNVEIHGLILTPLEYERRQSRFDMTLSAEEDHNTIALLLEYGTALFKDDTIMRYIQYIMDIAAAVAEDKEIRLADINIAPELSDSETELDLEAYGDFEF
jgi:tyrocidine synthetase III